MTPSQVNPASSIHKINSAKPGSYSCSHTSRSQYWRPGWQNEAWGLVPACNGMGTDHGPGGLSGQRNGQHPNFRQPHMYYSCPTISRTISSSAGGQRVHSWPLSVEVRIGKTLPLSLIFWSSQWNMLPFRKKHAKYLSVYSLTTMLALLPHAPNTSYILQYSFKVYSIYFPCLAVRYNCTAHTVCCHSVGTGDHGINSEQSLPLVIGLLVLTQCDYIITPFNSTFWASVMTTWQLPGHLAPLNFCFVFQCSTRLSFMCAIFSTPHMWKWFRTALKFEVNFQNILKAEGFNTS
jgi:hypothetical protein